MLLLPRATFTYRSPLSVQELTNRLAADMATEEALPNHQPHYRGTLYDGQFELRRLIDYRNPFLPCIEGTITDLGACRQVQVRLQLGTAALLIISTWFIVVVFIGITLLSGSSTQQQGWQATGTVLLFLLSGYGLMLGGFGAEAAKARTYFQRLSAA